MYLDNWSIAVTRQREHFTTYNRTSVLRLIIGQLDQRLVCPVGIWVEFCHVDASVEGGDRHLAIGENADRRQRTTSAQAQLPQHLKIMI